MIAIMIDRPAGDACADAVYFPTIIKKGITMVVEALAVYRWDMMSRQRKNYYEFNDASDDHEYDG